MQESTGKVNLKESSERSYCTIETSMNIFIRPRPEKPALKIVNDSIFVASNSPIGIYQWYWDGVPIGDRIVYNQVVFRISGAFSVEVFNQYDCPSRSDSLLYFVPEDINEVRVFPNPTESNLLMEWTSKSFEPLDVYIYSTSNGVIMKQTIAKPWATIWQEINASHLTPGAYIIKFRSNGRIYRAKFIKR
jgi:hypothetical protein